MSHPAVPLIADWLSSETGTYSLNTLLQTLPAQGDDVLPEPPTVYDDWRDDWVAAGQLPSTEDALAGITTPLVAVRLLDVTYAESLQFIDGGGSMQEGQIRIGFLLGLRGPDPAPLARGLGYLARALHSSVLALGRSSGSNRLVTGTGIQLEQLQSFKRSGPRAPIGDVTGVVDAEAVFTLYETTAVDGQ